MLKDDDALDDRDSSVVRLGAGLDAKQRCDRCRSRALLLLRSGAGATAWRGYALWVCRTRLIAFLFGVLLLSGPAALATTLDVSSTGKYIAEATGLVEAMVAAHNRETAAVNAVVERVSSGCRGGLPGYLRTGTPAQQRVWTALANEEPAGELVIALLRPVHDEYAAAAHAIGRLRWSRPVINRAVDRETQRTLAALALEPVDLCDDVRAAAASGFTTVPPDARRFITRATPLFLASDPAPAFSGSLKMFQRYITPADQTKVRALHALERRLDRLLVPADLHAYLALVDALRGPSPSAIDGFAVSGDRIAMEGQSPRWD